MRDTTDGVNSRSDPAPDGSVDRAREALSEARGALAEAERVLGQVEVRPRDQRPDQPQETEPSWRERLWTAPSEARVGVSELVEALGVSKSWIYSRTRESADPRLPHGKIGGSLVFKVGEIRAWVRDHEQVEEAYRMESAPGELRVEAGGAG